jgi:hypothetical protein
MALTQAQVREVAERYVREHPEIQATVVAVAHDGHGQWYALLAYPYGDREIIRISPDEGVLKAQVRGELPKGDSGTPPQRRGH